MRRWYEVWQGRVAATERLRMCIASKRISFRLFKQIYWQSFDEDIQVCLTHLHRMAQASFSETPTSAKRIKPP